MTNGTQEGDARRYGDGTVWRGQGPGPLGGLGPAGGSDGQRRRRGCTPPPRPLAKAKVRAMLAEARRGAPPMAPGGTTGEWLRTWLDDILPGTVAASTEAQYRQAVTDWVRPTSAGCRWSS